MLCNCTALMYFRSDIDIGSSKAFTTNRFCRSKVESHSDGYMWKKESPIPLKSQEFDTNYFFCATPVTWLTLRDESSTACKIYSSKYLPILQRRHKDYRLHCQNATRQSERPGTTDTLLLVHTLSSLWNCDCYGNTVTPLISCVFWIKILD